jgi:hypothetical protein
VVVHRVPVETAIGRRGRGLLRGPIVPLGFALPFGFGRELALGRRLRLRIALVELARR